MVVCEVWMGGWLDKMRRDSISIVWRGGRAGKCIEGVGRRWWGLSRAGQCIGGVEGGGTVNGEGLGSVVEVGWKGRSRSKEV